jgi:hypothetical protein
MDERHGKDANIVADDIRRAAEASGQDVATTARNLETSLHQMAASGMAGSSSGLASAGGQQASDR